MRYAPIEKGLPNCTCLAPMSKSDDGVQTAKRSERGSPQAPRAPESPRESRRTADLYRLLIETVTDYAIFVLDPRGHIASWNPGAARLKGYSESEIIGKHFSIFYPEEDKSTKPAMELKVATAEGRVEDEGWRVRKDGSRFWANVVITALHDESGALVGFAKITRDLTKRRESEDQARQLAASEAARQQAIKEKEEILKLSKQLKDQTDEYRAQTEEMQQLAAELEETNEELTKTMAESKQAAQLAQRAERRARYLVRAGDILVSSLNYQKTLQELANIVVPDLADWCGVSVADDGGPMEQVAVAHVDAKKVQLAKELSERYPQDPDAKTGVPNVMRTGKPELYAEITDDLLVAAAKDRNHLGMLRDLGMQSAMVVPLVAHGKTLGALTLISSTSGRRYSQDDVTFAMELARRAALAVDNSRAHRAERQARKQAEEANRAKMDFLSVMSHELRTPLNAIAGYAELLKIGVHGPVTPQQEQDLDRIIRSERSLLALINDVLNYAKLEAGHVDLRLAVIPVQDTLLDIEASVLPQLNAKELVYRKDLCPARARGDADKVRQIVLNLLSNAIKFTDIGGTITVGCSTDDECVKITVSDTGRGIPEDRLEAIFDPFVQVDKNLTRETEGTGLGLAISRDLARLMHGDIKVRSELGKGSVFTLSLPDAAAQKVPSRPAGAEAQQASSSS
jgi:PAS domain S-box-containing protein